MRKLLAGKALAMAAGAGAVVFNRGNATVGLIAAISVAVVTLGIEVFINRKSPNLLALNSVGAILAIATLTLQKMPVDMRFYLVVVIFAFVQLVHELVLNSRNGWFKKSNIDHLINFALHAAIWSVFVWVNLDTIGSLGAFGTYCAFLAVHWGIEATGPNSKG